MKTFVRLATRLSLICSAGFYAASGDIALATDTSGPAADALPPVGRSLFDFMVSANQNGRAVYDVPFPFERLTTMLATKSHGLSSPSGQMTYASSILVPNGRSLQKDFANLTAPRVVAAFTEHPLRSHDVGITLRDRIFIAYAANANQLEVISWNELAGRYEFQVVTDYRQGGQRQVQYASRSFCAGCHQQGLPLFSEFSWEETNSNMGIYKSLLASNSDQSTLASLGLCDHQIFGTDPVPPNCVATQGSEGLSYAVDASTERGGNLPSLMHLWQQGCTSVAGTAGLPANFTSEDCRASVFLYGLARAAGLAPDALSTSVGGHNFASYPQLIEIWKKNLSTGDLQIFSKHIPNRNPSDYAENQVQLIAKEDDRIRTWTQNLTDNKTFDDAADPTKVLPTAYPLVPGVEPAKQGLDPLLDLISGMIMPSERRVLPEDPAQFAAVIQTAMAKVLASGQAAAYFGAQPLLKGRILSAIFSAAGITQLDGQALQATCCDNTSGLPPAISAAPVISEAKALATANQTCGEGCHAVFTEPAKLGFLSRDPGMSDRDLFLKIVRIEGDEPCRRLDWEGGSQPLDPLKRMPKQPRQITTEQRRELLDAYHSELLLLASIPDALQALGKTADQLKAYAATCVFHGIVDSGAVGPGDGNSNTPPVVTVPPTNPTTGPTTGPGTTTGGGDAVALYQAAKAVIDRQCTYCHSKQTTYDNGGIDYFSDLNQLVANNKIKRAPNDPSKSRILLRMKSAGSPMPPSPASDPGGNPVNLTVPAPTPGDIDAVQKWIMANSPIP